MIDTYLFDWGDTLMVDFPGIAGKMCDWPTVEIVDGAKETLQILSKQARIFIATGAANSTELDIKSAFQRVGLDPFISGYFCEENIGIAKGSTDFLRAILNTLDIDTESVAMVGDSFDKDIKPATMLGIRSFWFKGDDTKGVEKSVSIINQLTELCP
ncbi:HAD family hydrolase [Psychromonas algicola]|uniref:HAD family hydrolase n=1 Tax=Psychromonas algicola TaxID=2555642 RepID=UPI001068A21E|nr:HAD family hydrolase [Psychromonas sp. RZ5]TEW52981.1 HAD family hydrolase [Psychromonas sp. RZ5]